MMAMGDRNGRTSVDTRGRGWDGRGVLQPCNGARLGRRKDADTESRRSSGTSLGGLVLAGAACIGAGLVGKLVRTNSEVKGGFLAAVLLLLLYRHCSLAPRFFWRMILKRECVDLKKKVDC